MDTEGFTFDLVTQRFLKNRWETELGKKVLEEVIDGVKNGVEVRAILDPYVLEHSENKDPYGHPFYPPSEMEENDFWVLTQDDLRGIHIYNESFPQNSSLTKKSLNYSRFYNCDFQNSNLERTELSMATFEKCNLKGVILAGSGGFGTRFIDSNLTEACLLDFGLINGDFSGSDLSNMYLESTTLENIKVNYMTVTDGSFGKNWRKRKQLGKELPEYLKSFRVAFQNANLWHRVDYFLNLERTENRKHILYKKMCLDKTITATTEWFSDLLWGATTGYGTKPFRLVILSIIVAFLYATIFQFAGNPASDGSFATSVYFSFTTFSTLGYGDLSYRNTRWIMRLLSSSEALVGATLIATFVAVLSRKVIRH
ncbi:MAG: hypothetical protein ACJAVU_003406 [Cognaticolwellia sp.]|jgi:hypothetical protein